MKPARTLAVLLFLGGAHAVVAQSAWSDERSAANGPPDPRLPIPDLI